MHKVFLHYLTFIAGLRSEFAFHCCCCSFFFPKCDSDSM